MPTLRMRAFISAGVGLVSGLFCTYLMIHFRQGAADFTWAIRAAQDLIAGQNPYRTPWQLYPLPAALFGLPFVWSPPEVAAGIFYGGSSALLAFGVTRNGYHGLLIFLAYPYWAGMLTVQWLPLIMASAFFPLLLAATLAKPQVGLPVALTHLSRRGVIACIALVGLTFLVMPHWLTLWRGQLGNYARFVPFLVWPGPLLLAALVRYRERDTWLLLIGALMPQRWLYDPFFLWLIPKKRREIVYTAGLSWGAGIWRWFHYPHTIEQVARWSIVWLYLPMLVVVLLRKPGRDGDCAERAMV